MRFDDINKIIEIMKANGLTEFEMEEDGVRISIKKGNAVPVIQAVAITPQQTAQTGSTPAAAPASAEVINDKMAQVKAPFVGTFYHSSSPDGDPYVSIGQEVEPETVLCIIEAMKVMNEIKAEMRGVVREILVENARPVQYGQILFTIEKP